MVIDGVTGFLPQPGDLAAMERAIGELLDDDAKRLSFGKAGQDLVRAKFPWQVMSDTLIEAYRKLLS